jgi:hypothetical protein
MKKTKPSPDQARHLITRTQVETLARGLSDHPAGETFSKTLTSSNQQAFEIWLPAGYCNDCALCKPRS